MAAPHLPVPDSPFFGPGGQITTPWRDFFLALVDGSDEQDDQSEQIAALEAAVAELQAQGVTQGVLQALGSLKASGTLAEGLMQIRFDGDSDEPGDNAYYGTQAGEKGWYARLLATLGDVDLTDLADGDALEWDESAGAFVPVTYQPLDDTLTALAGLDATAGLVEQTGPDAFTKRAMGVAAGTSVLTRADGDGRYDATGTAAAAVAAHVGLADPHPQYLTAAEGNAAYDAIGAAAAAQAASQPLDTQLTSLAGLSYAGNGLKLVRVNAGENAFELAAAGGGSGDVVGPASATDDRIATFDGATGKQIQDGGKTIAGVLSDAAAAAAVADAALLTSSISNGDTTHAPTGDAVFDALALKTNAAIVPNTAPAAGEILVGNAGGTAYAKQAMTGDVTLSSAGVSAIGAGKVTLAMQANMATASVVYRKTAGAGAPEVQTLATLKTDLGLSGTNTGDQTSVTGNAGTATALQTARNIDGQAFDGTANITVIAPGTNAAASKATPVNADELPLVDSAAGNVLKKLTWANLKATLQAATDLLYQPLLSLAANTFYARSSAGAAANKTITDFGLSLVDDANAAAGRTTLELGAANSPTFTDVIASGKVVDTTSGLGSNQALRITDFNKAFAGYPEFFSAIGTATNPPVTGQNWVGFALPLNTTSIGQLSMTLGSDGKTRVFVRGSTASTWGAAVEVARRGGVGTSAATGNLTPDINADDMTIRTAVTANLTINAPSGTKVNGRLHTIRLKSTGTWTITWNAEWKGSSTQALPAAHVANKTFVLVFMANADDNIMELISYHRTI
jgi:hypothetical protein